jgi:hypothetical protein
MSDDDTAVREHFIRGLGASTRHNALAYGYSLALTGTFGLLTILDRSPHVLDVFLFGVGGTLTFLIANAATTRGFRVKVAREPAIIRSLSSSLGFLSVLGALGVAALVAWGARGWAAWLVAPFAASAVYLVLSALEFVLARAIRSLAGREELEERE